MKFIASATLMTVLLLSADHAFAQETPLRIESLEVEQSDETLRAVKVQIRNVSSEPQSGFVWYVLASPGEPEPWRVHEYASPERPIRLQPGRTARVELVGPRDTFEGKLELSVWLHAVRPETGERFHSDMRRYEPLLVMTTAISFTVDYFVSDADGGEINVLVRFSVRNNQPRTAQIGIDYRITSLAEEPSPDLEALARTAEIAAGVDYVVTVRHPVPMPRQKLKLTGWIYQSVDGQLVHRGTDVTVIEPKD